jgi:hypothetical protein
MSWLKPRPTNTLKFSYKRRRFGSVADAQRRGVERQRWERGTSATVPNFPAEKIFDSLHIFLASKVNIRILHDANSLQVCAD